jgi:uncharacterized damage-inducible protein DinB
MDIQEIVTTGTRAQELLYSVAKEHQEICVRQIETISAFKSISQLLAHGIGAEQRWQARLTRTIQEHNYESDTVTDISQLHRDWQDVRLKTERIVDTGGPALLAEVIDVVIPARNIRMTMTGEQMIYNVMSHEAYHRAQCSYLLQIHGIDPPNFDYFLMLGA